MVPVQVMDEVVPHWAGEGVLTSWPVRHHHGVCKPSDRDCPSVRVSGAGTPLILCLVWAICRRDPASKRRLGPWTGPSCPWHRQASRASLCSLAQHSPTPSLAAHVVLAFQGTCRWRVKVIRIKQSSLLSICSERERFSLIKSHGVATRPASAPR